MLRIIVVTVLALLAGAALSTGTGTWVVRPGVVGLVAMVVGGILVKRHWQQLKLVSAEPGSPERALWLGLTTNAVIGGHLFASLWVVGPAMRLHSPLVHDITIDSWTMVFGALLSYLIARDREPRLDERDTQFAARGLKAGYTALLTLTLVLSVALSFGAGSVVARLSQAMVSHLLISAVIVASLVQYAAQLRLYAMDDAMAAAAHT